MDLVSCLRRNGVLQCRPSPSMNRLRSVASLGTLLSPADDDDDAVPSCMANCLSYCVPSVLIPSLIVFSDFIGALASGGLPLPRALQTCPSRAWHPLSILICYFCSSPCLRPSHPPSPFLSSPLSLLSPSFPLSCIKCFYFLL